MDESSERKEFERWFEADAMPAEHSNWFRREGGGTDGDYEIDFVDRAWRGWKARAEAAGPSPAQIEKAGRLLKVLRLAATPGMDAVAVKLNCGLTYDERTAAERWAKAFELARREGDLFALASELATY